MPAEAVRLGREALVTRTFVELADNLVESFDLIDVLTTLTTRSVEILGADAAGLLLADDGGRLRVVAASDDRTETLELYQLQHHEGPCVDCYATGAPVVVDDIESDLRWPGFAPRFVSMGFRAVAALPLRLRGDVLGGFGLFMQDPGGLAAEDLALGQALADAVSITIVQDHSARTKALKQQQLQHALDSRILIEQAKGMIAEYAGLTMDLAFDRLRKYARSNRVPLTETARSLVNRELPVTHFGEPPN